MNVVQKGFVLVAVPLLFMGAVLAATLWLVNTEERLFIAESRSRRVTTVASDIAASVLNCRAAVALYALTQDRSYLRPLATAQVQLPSSFDLLCQLVKDDPIELRYVSIVREKATQIIQVCQRHVEVLGSGHEHSVADALQNHDLSSAVHDLNAQVDAIRLREFYLTGNKPSELVLFRQKFQALVLVTAGLGVLLACTMAYFFASQISSRLQRLSVNANRLAKEEPLLPPLTGRDELAYVDGAFHDAAAALQKLETLRREFLAMVTHDLRSPLTAISLILQTLGHGCHGQLPKESEKPLADAQESTTRLLRLVNALLTVDKIVSGALELDRTPCDLDQVISQSIAEVHALGESKGLQIKLDARENHALTVIADKDKLVQVMVNLLSNAIKFSAVGSTVTITTAIPDKYTVKVAVTDSGRGVPQSRIDEIFERYKQVQVEDALRGSGLGLPICKAIIEAHGGSIGVVSEEGNGSTFWFTLTRTQEHSAAVALQQKVTT